MVWGLEWIRISPKRRRRRRAKRSKIGGRPGPGGDRGVAGRRHGFRRGAGIRANIKKFGEPDLWDIYAAIRFRGFKKSDIAKASLERLKPYLNAFTVLPNERVFEVVPKSTPFSKTLSFINSMLSDSLEGLIETIYDIGLINIDFADLRTILAGNGKVAFLNTVTFKKGEETNLDSFDKVFGSPLYPYTIDKARGVLLNIVAQKDLKLLEVNKILTSVAGRIHKDAKIIFGVGHEGAPDGAVRVTVLATGCVWGDTVETNIKDEVAAPVPKPKPEKIIKPSKPVREAKKSKPAAKKAVKPAAKSKKSRLKF